jgi:hypothetical protein
MEDESEIIQVVDRVFDEGRHSQIHDDMKVKLEAVIAAVFKANASRQARPRYAKKPVDQWKSQRVSGKRPLNPTSEDVPEHKVHALCNKITASNYISLYPTLEKYAEQNADMVVSTILKCIVKSGSFLPLYVRTLSDLHANYEEVVESYLSVMSDTFLENTEFQLVDNTESEDYDIFCAYIAEKASRLSRFKFLSMVGKYKDLTTALPAMIEVLGDKDSDVSKLMIVEMLELYYNCKACKSVKKQDVATFEKYTNQSQDFGIKSNARFKLMDLLAMVNRKTSV